MKPRVRTWRWMHTATLWAGIASVAQAQTPVSVPADDGGYLQWAVAGGIGLMVLIAAFLNPKRSHLN